jgi:hypothetical protein
METDAVSIEEVSAYYSGLNAVDREELLECLLIASTRGGDAMLSTLCEAIFVSRSKELIDRLRVSPWEGHLR